MYYMKKCFVYAILFCCFISMTHSDAFAGDSTSNSAGKSTDSLWTGEWERINCSQHEGAGIKITKTTSKGFGFSLDAACGFLLSDAGNIDSNGEPYYGD
jgi:hypothetical protein